MDFQSSIDFLSGTKKPKSEGGFDSALQFLEGLSAPPVAPLTPQQAQTQFAQIPFQPTAQPAPQAQAPQGNVLQRAIAPAASFLDVTLGGVAPGIIAPVTYAGSRAFGATPEQATASSQASAAPFVDPFGKMLGVSNLPQYKGETTRQIMDFVGANMGKGAAWISQQTGYPAADIENMMQTLTAGGGVAASRALAGRMGVSPAVTQVQEQFKQAQAARGRVEPIMTPEVAGAITPEAVATNAPEILNLNKKINDSFKQYEALGEKANSIDKDANYSDWLKASQEQMNFFDKELSPLYEQRAEIAGKGQLVVSKAPGIEVSYIEPTPVAPPNTPFITNPLQERIAPTSTTTPRPTIDNPFTEPMYAKTGQLPIEEQAYRAQTINELGIQRIREGTLTGDGKKTADEYATSQATGPSREILNNQLSDEQTALRNYAQKIIEKTGGSLGLDENALYNRGQAIAQPFDAFKNLLTEQMRNAYGAAKEVAADAPAVQPETFQKFLNTNSNFVVNDSFKSLRNGIKSHLTEQGLVNKDGSIKPMTVDQSEMLRQYINSNWNRDRSGIIHKLTDSIDNDVTKVAGTDVYEAARDIRTKMANLLEDPVGVSKIMDYDPKTPINRSTAFPDIPKAVEKMTPDQQAHLIKVLQDMPQELQPQAQKAIAEIKSQFANNIVASGGEGAWNAPKVTKYLKDNNRVLRILTEDPEMARMLTVLNDGGHFLRNDTQYKGAAIQTANMFDNPFIANTYKGIYTGIGGGIGYGIGSLLGGPTIGGLTGTSIGSGAGAALAVRKLQQKSSAKAVKETQKSLQPIQNVLKRLEKK
jgi:hypothetical protein